MTHPTKPLVEALAAGDWFRFTGAIGWIRLDRENMCYTSEDSHMCEYKYTSSDLCCPVEYRAYTPPPKTVRKKFYEAFYLVGGCVFSTPLAPTKERALAMLGDGQEFIEMREQFFEVPEGT